MQKEIKTFDITSLDITYIFDGRTIEEAIQTLQSKCQELIKTYPHYDNFKFLVEFDNGYTVIIQGDRLETDQEYEKRVRLSQRLEEHQRTRELNELARLKEKYES
jgi:RNase P/RNase MRP subunit p29